MNARSGLMIMVMLCICGCSSVQTVDPTRSTGDCLRVSREAAGHEASIELRDGTIERARYISVGSDSTSWQVGRHADTRRSVATGDVLRVTIRDRVKGAMHGAIAGFVGVTAIELAYNIAQLLRDRDEDEDVVVLSCGCGLVPGLPLGAVIGGLKGSVKSFEFMGHQSSEGVGASGTAD
jgi:hypothetical protein